MAYENTDGTHFYMLSYILCHDNFFFLSLLSFPSFCSYFLLLLFFLFLFSKLFAFCILHSPNLSISYSLTLSPLFSLLLFPFYPPFIPSSSTYWYSTTQCTTLLISNLQCSEFVTTFRSPQGRAFRMSKVFPHTFSRSLSLPFIWKHT